MQWLVSIYCAIMGAVQLYTHLPVGCNSRFSPLATSCQLLGLKTVTGSKPLLLLDAAPIIIPLPPALEFVALPRTESLTATSFDRLIHNIYTMPEDIGTEWTVSFSSEQLVRCNSASHRLQSVLTGLMVNYQPQPTINIRVPKHLVAVAGTLLLCIAMILIVLSPRPDARGSPMVRPTSPMS